MIIRDCEAQDLDVIRVIHSEMPCHFDLPDLASHNIVLAKALCDGDRVTMAGFLRKTTEAYLVCDPKWRTPRWRLEALGLLVNAIAGASKEKDIEDTHVWVQSKRFGERLMQLGWEKPLWHNYTYRIRSL